MIIDDLYYENTSRVIFINDGAAWQWKWSEAEYLEEIRIIDFYHV